MDSTQIRELTDQELEEQIQRMAEELFHVRFRAAYEELENPSLLRTLRRELARMKTIRHERRLAAGGQVNG